MITFANLLAQDARIECFGTFGTGRADLFPLFKDLVEKTWDGMSISPPELGKNHILHVLQCSAPKAELIESYAGLVLVFRFGYKY